MSIWPLATVSGGNAATRVTSFASFTVSWNWPTPAPPSARTSTWNVTGVLSSSTCSVPLPLKVGVPAVLAAPTWPSTDIRCKPKMSPYPAIKQVKWPLAEPPHRTMTTKPKADPSMSPSLSRSATNVPVPPPLITVGAVAVAVIGASAAATETTTNSSSLFIALPFVRSPRVLLTDPCLPENELYKTPAASACEATGARRLIGVVTRPRPQDFMHGLREGDTALVSEQGPLNSLPSMSGPSSTRSG